MAKRTKRTTPTIANGTPTRPGRANLHDCLLADFRTLKVPLNAAQLDAVAARAERDGLTHLEFAHLLIAEQAQQRRERAIARRIKDAGFRELCTLAGFDGDFNKTINRVQIEELATAAFIGRQDNLVLVGQSGVGKSRIIQSVGQAAQTLPKCVRRYARYDLLIIDEFGFDKIERSETPQAANLLYKIIDARTQRSTALVTNIDFDAWGEYLGDPPLAMAFLDRVVDGAIILKIKGRSYRAHRAEAKVDTPAK
jgi:DNA replication protein DnaC